MTAHLPIEAISGLTSDRLKKYWEFAQQTEQTHFFRAIVPNRRAANCIDANAGKEIALFRKYPEETTLEEARTLIERELASRNGQLLISSRGTTSERVHAYKLSGPAPF